MKLGVKQLIFETKPGATGFNPNTWRPRKDDSKVSPDYVAITGLKNRFSRTVT